MKKKLIILILILVSFLTVFSESSNFYWYRTSEGARTNVDVFRPAEGGDSGEKWAVFAINGRMKLTGSSSIEPLDSGNISGRVGTNANGMINGDYPVILGEGAESVILPCNNFYFGPGASPALLVGGGNEGPEAIARLDCLKNYAHVLDSIQSFVVPSWLAFEQTGVLGLPIKEPYVAGWNGGPFEISTSDTGFYDSFTILSQLTIDVYDEDIILHTNSLKVASSGGSYDLRIRRHGEGRVFILVNETLELSSDAKILSYDADDNEIVFDENLFLFYNGTNAMAGYPQFQFSGLMYVKQAPIQIGGSTRVSGLVSLHNQVTVSGAGLASRFVYAPYADIIIDNSGEVQGTVIGKSIDILNDGKIKYEVVEILIPNIPQPFDEFDWVFFTREGYDLRGSITINGNIAIHETKELNINGNAYTFNGDAIINNLTGYTVAQVDAQNNGSVVLEDFDIPSCLFQNNPGDVIDESYSIHYAGNDVIEGMLYAPNATEIKLNGTMIIKGGVCAPNAKVIIGGNVNVSKFMLVKFLEMQGNPDFTLNE